MARKLIDVVVVGAGPGGCIAAKKCAQSGLDTLMVEKKRLPRDKVCTGMILGPWAKGLIRAEFGEIPARVLVEPYKGIALHVGRGHSIIMPAHIPVGWRKNLDYWMCRRAVEAGVNVRDDASVTGITGHEDSYAVKIRTNDGIEEIDCRFVIGADGANSQVRKIICPDIKSRLRTASRECYEVPLSIEKEYFHWFFPLVTPSPRFDVNYKEGFFLIEGGGVKEIRDEVMGILRGFGMPPDAKAVWRDGSAIPVLYDELFSGSFVPAKGNVLLVGDAGGLPIPFTQEGIGTALKSGLFAAESVIEALQGNGKADRIYLAKVREIIEALKYLWRLQQGLSEKARKGAGALCEGIRELIEESLKRGPGFPMIR